MSTPKTAPTPSVKFDPERLLTVLLAPTVSEKATQIADKHAQVVFRVAPDATKPEVKAAVEMLFKVEVDERADRQRQGQAEAFRRHAGRRAELEEGLRLPEARPGNQLRAGGLTAMPLVKVKPTSPGRRALVKVVNPDLFKGRAIERAHREQEARLRTQQQRPHHDAAPGRRTQAPLPHRRLPSQQGRHRGQGRAAGVRPEPQRAPCAAALHRWRAPLHRCSCGVGGRRAAHERPGRTDQAGQLPAPAQHPRRHDHPLRRDAGRARARKSPVRRARRCSSSRARARMRNCACISGEIRRVHVDCRATIGSVGNEEHNLRSFGKAGAKRWRGIRPTVRGEVMNPVDHPHGGAHPRQPPSGVAVGHADQGLSHAQEQAHRRHDRPPSSRRKGLIRHHGSLSKKGSVRGPSPAVEGRRRARDLRQAPDQDLVAPLDDHARFRGADDRRSQREAAHPRLHLGKHGRAQARRIFLTRTFKAHPRTGRSRRRRPAPAKK